MRHQGSGIRNSRSITLEGTPAYLMSAIELSIWGVR
jgi:hypothetical protein